MEDINTNDNKWERAKEHVQNCKKQKAMKHKHECEVNDES